MIQEIIPENKSEKISFEEVGLPILPKEVLEKEEFQKKNFSVNIKEKTELHQNFMKTQIFKDRMNQLIKIIDPTSKKLLV